MHYFFFSLSLTSSIARIIGLYIVLLEKGEEVVNIKRDLESMVNSIKKVKISRSPIQAQLILSFTYINPIISPLKTCQSFKFDKKGPMLIIIVKHQHPTIVVLPTWLTF